MKRSLIAASALLAALSGCAQDDLLRTEGLTLTVGDSIAKNSALQIIDPWPAGVEDTDLVVPADRGGTQPSPSPAPPPTTPATP